MRTEPAFRGRVGMLFGTIAFLLSTIHLSGVFMIDCLNCFPKLEPIAKKMIVNTMAMMVLRDAILDDITSVNSMMWYINLLITLFHRCDAVARSLLRSFSVFQYDKIHKNESRTTMIAMSLVAIMFIKKATTYYGIPTTRNGGCVNMAMKNDIGFNSCGNDSNGKRENLDGMGANYANVYPAKYTAFSLPIHYSFTGTSGQV